MVNAHLLNYVRQQLAAGYAPEQIRLHLVGSGYPVRDVDEAIDHATRPARKPLTFEEQIAESAEQKPEQILARAEKHKKKEEEFVEFFGLLKLWFMSLLMPAQVFEEEKEKASFTKAFTNILLAGALSGLIAGIIVLIKYLITPASQFSSRDIFGFGGIVGSLDTIEALVSIPIVAILTWLSISAFFYLFSLLMGGSETFERFSYLTSLFAAPLALMLGIASASAPSCILFFIFIVFGVIGIYPMLFAIKEAHDFDTIQAIIATVIPIILVTVLLIPAIMKLTEIFGTICK